LTAKIVCYTPGILIPDNAEVAGYFRFAVLVAAVLASPGPVLAASLNWTGAVDSDWHNADNWSPAQAPTSGDDAAIDWNGTVTIAAGSPAAAFNSLALGGTKATVLKVSGLVSTAGSLTINAGGILQHDTDRQLSFGQIVISSGGKITHTANSNTRLFLSNLRVTGDFILSAGSAINLDGKGYGSVSGPGAGINGAYDDGGGGGGGHGGSGGAGSGRGLGGPGGYDSITNPIELGSGGGNSCNGVGGKGGGALIAVVGGTARLDGLVTANGTDGAATGQCIQNVSDRKSVV
jgi:hypothetical protein